jgi:hypothetical protein
MSTHRTRRPDTHDKRLPWAGAALLGGALAAGALTGCGSIAAEGAGPTTTQQRPVDGVHAVKLLTSGDLTLITGPTSKLTVTAGRKTLRALTSGVYEGMLVLGSKPGHNSRGDIHYVLTLPSVDTLITAGSGDVHGPVANTGPFALTVSGSGGVHLTGLESSQLTLQVQGSGDTTLTGTIAAQQVSLSGSGTYDGTRLSTLETNIETAGSGDAQISVTRQLTARVTGSGNITYTGAPTTVKKNISGNGDINAI